MYHLVDFDVHMKISVNITINKYYINVYNEYKLFFTYDYVETELLDRWVKFNATFVLKLNNTYSLTDLTTKPNYHYNYKLLLLLRLVHYNSHKDVDLTTLDIKLFLCPDLGMYLCREQKYTCWQKLKEIIIYLLRYIRWNEKYCKKSNSTHMKLRYVFFRLYSYEMWINIKSGKQNRTLWQKMRNILCLNHIATTKTK